jgi:hypothetical protein
MGLKNTLALIIVLGMVSSGCHIASYTLKNPGNAMDSARGPQNGASEGQAIDAVPQQPAQTQEVPPAIVDSAIAAGPQQQPPIPDIMEPEADTPNDPNSIEETYRIDTAAKKGDIIISLSTMNSMVPRVAEIQAAMKGFVDSLVGYGYDFQIFIIGRDYSRHEADCRAAVLAGYKICIDEKTFGLQSDLLSRFSIVDRYVYRTESLGHLANFLDGKYENARTRKNLVLRPGAATEVIIVSDGDGSNENYNNESIYGVTGRNLANQFVPPSALKPRVHTIVGQTGTGGDHAQTDPNNGCNVVEGKEYNAVADRTGGGRYNICSSPLSAALNSIAARINTGYARVTMKKDYDSRSALKVYVNNVLITSDQYQVSGREVILTSAIDAGSEVKVVYVPLN